jgi:hypothetical protein
VGILLLERPWLREPQRRYAFLLDAYNYRVEVSKKLVDVTTTLNRIKSTCSDSLTTMDRIVNALVKRREGLAEL